jgi:hypothetical protein
LKEECGKKRGVCQFRWVFDLFDVDTMVCGMETKILGENRI